jgi:hypothetical protein
MVKRNPEVPHMPLFGQVMHVQNSFGHHTGLRVSRTVLRTAKNPDRDVFASIAITPLVCLSRYEGLTVSDAGDSWEEQTMKDVNFILYGRRE